MDRASVGASPPFRREFCHSFVTTTACIGRTGVRHCQSPSNPLQENKSRGSGIEDSRRDEKRANISGRDLKKFDSPRIAGIHPGSQFVQPLRVFQSASSFSRQKFRYLISQLFTEFPSNGRCSHHRQPFIVMRFQCSRRISAFHSIRANAPGRKLREIGLKKC
jgi:hypothetical protein